LTGFRSVSRIRITGGDCRSRLITVAAVPGLRPTPDRVRVTLFNWLGQDLTGLSCLDLFAGSGILGLEAASRGAAPVTLVERDRRACAALRRNANNLALSGVEVEACDALEFAVSPRRRYDLIFLDPPYHAGWLARLAPLLDGLATTTARVYAEAERTLDGLGDAAGWRCRRQARAGQVHFHLFERE
jgi:16S rRNA (guanine(966)-N(2))-methyltransferase RsmD